MYRDRQGMVGKSFLIIVRQPVSGSAPPSGKEAPLAAADLGQSQITRQIREDGQILVCVRESLERSEGVTWLPHAFPFARRRKPDHGGFVL